MTKKSWWLQAGPAKRCAKAAVFWGTLAAFSLVLSLVVRDVAWWAQLSQSVATLLVAGLALAYGLSYRTHRAVEAGR
jgi:hypothetical protein